MPPGAFVPLERATPTDLDRQLARLTAERQSFVVDIARSAETGGRPARQSPKRAVRARAAADAADTVARYNQVCAEIDRLSELQKAQAGLWLADWMRARPQAAREVMLRLPPLATVQLIDPVADLAAGALGSVVYYADDGNAIGVIRVMLDDGSGEHEAFDLQANARMVKPDGVELVPVLTQLTPERVAELLAV